MRFVSRILTLLLVSQLFFGCSDVTNELWIDDDGSGRLEISVDLASFLPQDLQDSVLPSDSSDTGTDEMEALFSLLIKDGVVQQIDTVISLRDVLTPPDSVEVSAKAEKMYESMSLHLSGDSVSGVALASLHLEFENEADFEELMDPLQGSATRSDSLDLEIEKFKEDFSIDIDRGIIRLPFMKPPANLPNDTPDEFSQGLESMQGDDEESKQMRAMLEELMGSIVTKVHLPGKVEFSNDPNAIIEGKTIIFNRPILSLMVGSENQPARLIKFQK